MDDIAEQQDVAKEISDAISNPVAFGNDIDEDELEKELEELEQEELDKELLGVGPSATDELPDVPVDELQEKAKTKKKGKCWKCSLIAIFHFLLVRTVPAAAAVSEIDDDPDMKQLLEWSK